MPGIVGISEIAQAKRVLKKAGYCVENMWQTADVKHHYPNFSSEECMEILGIATEDAIENIWEQIHNTVESYTQK